MQVLVCYEEVLSHVNEIRNMNNVKFYNLYGPENVDG